jgi:serine/threonine protein phosphatase 1
MKHWPVELDYPIVAITDVHGQRLFLERLLRRLEDRPEWPDCSVVFVGDYVDRGPDVHGTIEVIRELTRWHPSPVTAVMGNHDLALVRAARLDDGAASDYWIERYLESYDHDATFRPYLHRMPRHLAWEEDLLALRDAMPAAHRRFLSTLPWLVEASGHLFLHCGLSPELEQPADEQLEALRARRWDDSL